MTDFETGIAETSPEIPEDFAKELRESLETPLISTITIPAATIEQMEKFKKAYADELAQLYTVSRPLLVGYAEVIRTPRLCTCSIPVLMGGCKCGGK